MTSMASKFKCDQRFVVRSLNYHCIDVHIASNSFFGQPLRPWQPPNSLNSLRGQIWPEIWNSRNQNQDPLTFSRRWSKFARGLAFLAIQVLWYLRLFEKQHSPIIKLSIHSLLDAKRDVFVTSHFVHAIHMPATNNKVIMTSKLLECALLTWAIGASFFAAVCNILNLLLHSGWPVNFSSHFFFTSKQKFNLEYAEST